MIGGAPGHPWGEGLPRAAGRDARSRVLGCASSAGRPPPSAAPPWGRDGGARQVLAAPRRHCVSPTGRVVERRGARQRGFGVEVDEQARRREQSPRRRALAESTLGGPGIELAPRRRITVHAGRLIVVAGPRCRATHAEDRGPAATRRVAVRAQLAALAALPSARREGRGRAAPLGRLHVPQRCGLDPRASTAPASSCQVALA
jgi:hypothetical protein